MDDYTLSKIQIYKADPVKWQAAILKVIPKDQLPVHFGGTLTDPDGNPRYTSKVSFVKFFLVKFLSKFAFFQNYISTEYSMKYENFNRICKVLCVLGLIVS